MNICPVCKGKHTLYTAKNEIFCEKCGRLTGIDQRYKFDNTFKFLNLQEWYDWQTEIFKAEIEADKNFALCDNVELRLPSVDGKTMTRHAGYGICTLDRNGLRFEGERDGEAYSVSFTLKRLYRLLFGAGENFEIYNGPEILYFVPADKRSCVDWYIVSKLLYDEKY